MWYFICNDRCVPIFICTVTSEEKKRFHSHFPEPWRKERVSSLFPREIFSETTKKFPLFDLRKWTFSCYIEINLWSLDLFCVNSSCGKIHLNFYRTQLLSLDYATLFPNPREPLSWCAVTEHLAIKVACWYVKSIFKVVYLDKMYSRRTSFLPVWNALCAFLSYTLPDVNIRETIC